MHVDRRDLDKGSKRRFAIERNNVDKQDADLLVLFCDSKKAIAAASVRPPFL